MVALVRIAACLIEDVVSKDHIVYSPATITGYALGIKLIVPLPPAIHHL